MGELICLSGRSATADWQLVTEARCFCVPAERLRALAAADNELRRALETGFARDAYEKMRVTEAVLRRHTLVAEAQMWVP
ncbi:hypothetical protein [Rhodovulum sp. ES.010]|uniref:hypothetical protein n=1 Tax=Rhodovulum sp. ES.010 TaxID=1882821 RepID=UPI000941197C|nr:hypothetical protein [Rhodovulum sp. ES.010]